MAGWEVDNDTCFLGNDERAEPIVPQGFFEWYVRFVSAFLKLAFPGITHVVLDSLIVYRVGTIRLNFSFHLFRNSVKIRWSSM